jgi:hypothetical protein
MSENLFDYRPIKSWTGDIIDFGTGSSSVNYGITAICTDANDVSDAIFRVDAYSSYDVNTAKYINETILKFFRGEIDESYISGAIIEYETHIIESFLSVIMDNTIDSFYEIDIKGILPKQLSLADYGIFNKHIEEPRTMSLAVGTINNVSNPTEHGMPYMTLAWSGGALDPRCENSAYTSQSACEAAVEHGTCIDNGNPPPVVSGLYTNHQVTNYHELDELVPLTEAKCVNGQYSPQYGGRCFYSNNNGQTWNYYGSNWTKSTCLEYTQTIGGWDYLWWTWMEDGNTWTPRYYNWWPSTYTSTIMFTSQTIYEGEGIYFLPKMFELAGTGASSLTMNYDTFDIRGQSKIGRQSRVFYIGYGIEEDGIAYQTQINPDNYLHANLPAHLEVNDNNSKVGLIYGYTTYYDRTRIQWKRPQYWKTNPAHGIPDRYRIYRSNYYYYGITSPTEYTMGIKRLVGEVPVTDVDGYQYFEEDEQDLRAEGLLPYQYCYYFITAVYDDWGTSNRGLFYGQYNFYWNDNITAFDGQSPSSTYVEVLEIDQSGNDLSTSHSQRWTGYFKAQKSGVHSFKLTSDDSAYLWIGNSGDDITTLSNNITLANALIDNGGTHPPTSVSATITLNEGEYYPILLFYGNKNLSWPYTGGYQNTLAFTPPGGVEQTSGVGYYFMSNNNSNPGTGQEVEGRFTTNQLRSYFR